ncbi:hypothetical protein HDU86_000895 [Geranomyces michiganensis]|nr:hypothetical protein HDU86_000895 [Geranomyces michiganensis]
MTRPARVRRPNIPAISSCGNHTNSTFSCALEQPSKSAQEEEETGRFVRFVSDVETTSLLRFESSNTVDWPQEARRLFREYQKVQQSSAPLNSTHSVHFRALVAVALRGAMGSEPVKAVMQDMSAAGVRLTAQDWGRLITAFGREGEIDLAMKTLSQLHASGDPKPDASCYNAIIEAFADRGDCKNAHKYSRLMHLRGARPTQITAMLLVDAYLNAGDAKRAKRQWGNVVRRYGVSRATAEKHRPRGNIAKHRVLQTYHELINRACKRGAMREAMRFYNGLVVRGTTPVLMTYAHLLAGFVQQRDHRGARMLLERMRFMRVKPDVRIYSTLIDLHGKLGRLDDATRFLRLAIADGIEPDVALFNVLINAYGIAGDLAGMRGCYDMILARGLQPDRYTFATLAHAHMRSGDAAGSHRWLEIAEERHDSSTPMTISQRDKDRHADAIILAALVEGHCRMGDLTHASVLMAQARRKGLLPLAEAFTSLIAAHLRANDIEGAARWFDEMRTADVTPDSQVYGMMIAAYTRVGNHVRTAALIASMTEMNVTPSGRTGGYLILARIGAGDVEAAMDEYERMVDLGCEVPLQNLPALITAFAKHLIGVLKWAPEANVTKLHKSLMTLFGTYQARIAREGVASSNVAYDVVVEYLLTRNMLDQAQNATWQILAEECAEPQAPLLRIARHILDHDGWAALRDWNSEIENWINATQREQYARRVAENGDETRSDEDEMQWLWKDGLLAESDLRVEKEANLTNTHAKVIRKLVLQTQTFTYGKYASVTLALDPWGQQHFDVVAAFAEKSVKGEEPKEEAAISAYWTAVLALRKRGWPGTFKPRQPLNNTTAVAASGTAQAAKKPISTWKTISPLPIPTFQQPNPSSTRLPSFLLAAPSPLDPPARALEESITEMLSTLSEAKRTLPGRLAARRDHSDPHLGPARRDEEFVAFCAGLLRYCERRHFWKARKTVMDELGARGWEFGEDCKGFGPPARDADTKGESNRRSTDTGS